jgi:hypothetical protein
MTVLSRKLVREEVATGLAGAITGSNKPASSVYPYLKGKLDGESPVVFVLSRGIQRKPRGMGSKSYDSDFRLEIQVLVYDGPDNNPLTEQQREDKVDEIEAAIADWFVKNQTGTNYYNAEYTVEPTGVSPIIFLDGNPYLMERITVRMEGRDS